MQKTLMKPDTMYSVWEIFQRTRFYEFTLPSYRLIRPPTIKQSRCFFPATPFLHFLINSLFFSTSLEISSKSAKYKEKYRGLPKKVGVINIRSQQFGRAVDEGCLSGVYSVEFREGGLARASFKLVHKSRCSGVRVRARQSLLVGKLATLSLYRHRSSSLVTSFGFEIGCVTLVSRSGSRELRITFYTRTQEVSIYFQIFGKCLTIFSFIDFDCSVSS